MVEDKCRNDNIEEALIVNYEPTGKIVFRSQKNSYETENEGLARQLSALKITPSSTVMVPVELITDKNSVPRLGRLQIPEGMMNREDDASSLECINQEGETSQAEVLHSTLKVFFKQDFPFGFDAFGIADLSTGHTGYTLFYSNRIGKFYVKNENLTMEGGGIHLFVRGVADAPSSMPQLQFIHQPVGLNGVKIVKQKEVIFKGVLFIGWHNNASAGEDEWIGWNDHIGIPSFTPHCSRNILMKNRDWDFRSTFATFSSVFNPVTRDWRITELGYSNVDIASTEGQIPCSLFIIDDLLFEGVRGPQGVFVSRDNKRHDGSPLRVAVRDENCNFDPDNLKRVYAAIVCPLFSQGGQTVSFRALALFPREEWLNDPRKKELAGLFYTWTADRELGEKIAECNQPVIKV